MLHSLHAGGLIDRLGPIFKLDKNHQTTLHTIFIIQYLDLTQPFKTFLAISPPYLNNILTVSYPYLFHIKHGSYSYVTNIFTQYFDTIPSTSQQYLTHILPLSYPYHVTHNNEENGFSDYSKIPPFLNIFFYFFCCHFKYVHIFLICIYSKIYDHSFFQFQIPSQCTLVKFVSPPKHIVEFFQN